ncbi:MAG TPA: tetratricopeptide repeat protein, partial [Candidatus Paceibacterota bacterium]|nr:tetratricopeptide repeat protein [Candidatus Paceibacterota bacterium]
GHARLASGRAAQALEDYDAALLYPTNLEVGRPHRDRKAAQIHYFRGTAHEALGNTPKAAECFELAVDSPESGPSEIQFAQALALAKQGRADEARKRFEGLLSAGQRQIEAGEQADYFAKFGERESERVRKARAHYLVGLGQLGLGRTDDAKAAFAQALELHPAHVGAALAQAALKD